MAGDVVAVVRDGEVAVPRWVLTLLVDALDGGDPCRLTGGVCVTHGYQEVGPGEWCPVEYAVAALEAGPVESTPFAGSWWRCRCGLVWDKRSHDGPCPRCQLARAVG